MLVFPICELLLLLLHIWFASFAYKIIILETYYYLIWCPLLKSNFSKTLLLYNLSVKLGNSIDISCSNLSVKLGNSIDISCSNLSVKLSNSIDISLFF